MMGQSLWHITNEREEFTAMGRNDVLCTLFASLQNLQPLGYKCTMAADGCG
jgi:hypothetical protein